MMGTTAMVAMGASFGPTSTAPRWTTAKIKPGRTSAIPKRTVAQRRVTAIISRLPIAIRVLMAKAYACPMKSRRERVERLQRSTAWNVSWSASRAPRVRLLSIFSRFLVRMSLFSISLKLFEIHSFALFILSKKSIERSSSRLYILEKSWVAAGFPAAIPNCASGLMPVARYSGVKMCVSKHCLVLVFFSPFIDLVLL
jgi:hypothetical protein